MKNFLKILFGFAIAVVLGFVKVDPDKERIAELEKELAELKQTSGCYSRQVRDGDLYQFLETNQNDPNLIAIKVKVTDLINYINTNGLKDVYFVIAHSEGYLNLLMTGKNVQGVISVCHDYFAALGKPRKCCPPSTVCTPGTGIINKIPYNANF